MAVAEWRSRKTSLACKYGAAAEDFRIYFSALSEKLQPVAIFADNLSAAAPGNSSIATRRLQAPTLLGSSALSKEFVEAKKDMHLRFKSWGISSIAARLRWRHHSPSLGSNESGGGAVGGPMQSVMGPKIGRAFYGTQSDTRVILEGNSADGDTVPAEGGIVIIRNLKTLYYAGSGGVKFVADALTADGRGGMAFTINLVGREVREASTGSDIR
ncbi:hypothetical protein DFH09DRAFT_1282601 [Mycena vulgaris]|nr:hypothetical protein DFH09DRAFT_1282601 [Mycena vulgaris]